jgi:hypothetical protein
LGASHLFGVRHFSAVPSGLGPPLRRNPALKCRAIFGSPLTRFWFGSLARVETNERKDLAAVFLPALERLIGFFDGDFIA